MLSELLSYLDPARILTTFSYVGLFAIIFAESGLLIGFFFPGDSLLFTAGIFAAAGHLSLPIVVVGCTIAAIAGVSAGYGFGKAVGKGLFERKNSLLFRRQHLYRAQAFYDKHGGKTLILARFIPIVRTFAPIVAGVSEMEYRKFLAFNVIGGVLWAAGVTIAGYTLGNAIPNIDRYLLPIIAVIIVISVLPAALHAYKEYRQEIHAALRRRAGTP